MNNLKKIKAIIPPSEPHMVGDGFRVHNFFPSSTLIGTTGMSPFFLLDYNSKWDVPPSNRPKGVGVHPHRGFEAVTIVCHGRVAHHDSAGNSGIIAKGDVQWMTAGSGVLHKEYHESEFSKQGGLFQMSQVWVNLPARYKMTTPKYQALEHKNMGRFILEDKKSVIDIIAGEYRGIKGPAKTFTPVYTFNARLLAASDASFSFPENYNTGILIFEGEARINGSDKIPEDHFVYFANEGENINVSATNDSILLILSGEPLNEPVVSGGPFLMNSEEEIKKAYQDYRNGLFGKME